MGRELPNSIKVLIDNINTLKGAKAKELIVTRTKDIIRLQKACTAYSIDYWAAKGFLQ